MGFRDNVTSLWQADAKSYVHGWVHSGPPAPEVDPGAGKHYLQVRLAGMSLRFARDRFAGWTPVMQSSIVWPVGGERVTVSTTVDHTRFSQASDDAEGTQFAVYQVADLALCGDLPLNGGDVEVNVGLLAVPGSSLLDEATAFLTDIASLTLVPQLSAAAPVATKIAGGVDKLLGNDQVKGVLAFATSVPADRARAGFYLVTDLPADSALDLKRFTVMDHALMTWSDDARAWQPAAGFSYLLLEFVVAGPKPTRWAELPEITELSEAALTRLAQATTEAEVAQAAPQLKLAAMKALYSPDLAHIDRDPAAQALIDQWKLQVQRLGGLGAAPTTDRTDKPRLTEPDLSETPDMAEKAAEQPAVVTAAQRVSEELDAEVQAIQVGEVDVTARDVAGSVKGIVASKLARLVVQGATRVDAQGVTGTVVGIEVS